MPVNYQMLGAKKNMIEMLKTKGITDSNVLQAFDKVDRHLFIDSFLWNIAYEDIAIKLMADQTMSHPSTVAFQTQLLQVQKGDKVLEIGTGSGYQAAILSAMGARVFTIERQQELYNKTYQLLSKLDGRIALHFGDGFKGWPMFAPYKKIIVTCGAPNVPQALLQQLAVGGVMVIPVGDERQTMLRITKVSEEQFEEEKFGDFLFVPMLREKVTLK